MASMASTSLSSSSNVSLPPLRSLKEILTEWGVGDIMEGGIEGLSSELKARVVPCFDEEMFTQNVCNGIPSFGDEKCTSQIKEVVGEDGLEFVCSKQWNEFLEKKVAMVGGWGRPGTPVDAINDRDLALVSSFFEVLTDPRRLNLQMFHREGESGLPVLPELLDWPCDDLFNTRQEGPIDTPHSGYPATTVDRATRVSRKGAVTWWHLDDSGEHVFQVALPLRGDAKGKIVKVFIFAELDDYDFIFQDEETNSTGRIAAFDPFRTASSSLPTGGKLPTFWVAGLRAGGEPLLSPPNMPHMVITTENCVMVEERRVSVLFMDEVCYFMNRAAKWHTIPILYHFLRYNLCQSNMVEEYVSKLLAVMNSSHTQASISACAKQSLIAISQFLWHPQFEDMELDRSLLLLKENTMGSLREVLKTQSVDLTLRHERHRRASFLLGNMRQEVTDLGWGLQSTESDTPRFASVVHDGGKAVWGPARTALPLALEDHLCMQLALDSGNLGETLSRMKDETSDRRSKTNNSTQPALESIFGSDSDSD